MQVKHRQLVCQVWEFTYDPLVTSMETINFNIVLEEGTTFVFGSWVCIANSLNGFNNHVTNPREPKESPPVSINNVNSFNDIQLSNLIGSHARHLQATPAP